ncbi:EAL domain-containing protein [Pigmentiphaga soli]|uniref:EAL domain-containing protein n=1 Tax=Pigmentiphaga soli TaxID=1007095 RepID=A0ABP8GHU8_9BURK
MNGNRSALSNLRSFIIRHRVSIQDFSLLAVALCVAAYIFFEVDVFENEATATPRAELIELDETLLLGGLFAAGLLVFSVRRYRDQKRENARRTAAERRIRELAFQDPLTGLANRRQLEDTLAAAIAAPPAAGAMHCLLLLDLNGFKQVNDVHGHAVGDEVLIEVARRLVLAVREGDLVARLGGDEFAIVAQHLVGPEAATNIALRIRQELAAPVAAGTGMHQISAGIGMARIPQDADTRDEAMRKADVALYRAKAERRTALRFFEEEMDRLVQERARMERAFRAAVAAGAIEPVYQPSVDLRSRQVVGFEARPRWIDAELGPVPPERFLPIAEETGLIHDLATQLLRQACSVAARWPAGVTLSIDLLPGQLADRDLKDRIVRILGDTGFDPRRLEIEITENTLVHHLAAAQRVLGSLREMGVRIALDNFGTGYSSLYHLRNFKLDKVKIDRSFIESMGVEQESADIVNALAGLGRGLGLTLAAEGIADPDQQAALIGSGCEQGQGHLFSEPIEAARTLELVAQPAAAPA